jgi:PAS domain-containing protein
MYSVLYVDDEKSLLEIAQIFLQISGEFRVSIMTSAQKALDSPSIWSYDAIISDYQMPGMDGIAFLKAVRERFGDIPFILFTGRGREEVVIDAINNGADFYLQKGGDPESQFAELAHKIRQVVRRKRAERSLRDSERRLSDIIDFLPDATFAIDRSGQVIAWNRAIEEMTGIPADDMLGKGNYEYAMPFYGTRRPILIDLLNEPDETIAQYYSNIYRTGNSLTAQTDLPHPKGHRISVLVKVSLLYNPAGEVTGAIESVRDITNIKKAEEELRAANEQITADEEKLRSQYGELAESERTLRINEERLIMAQGIGHTGSWEYDPATNKIWGSAEGLHIFGLT